MPLVVRGGEAVRDLQRVLDGLARRERADGREPLAQRLALEQLHDGVGDAAVLAEVVDGQDVRVRERRDGLRLALEARERVGVRRRARGQDLDRDVAVSLVSRAR